MQKRESRMQTTFKHYLQSQWNNGSAAFELKRTMTNRLSVSAVKEHQVAALACSYNGTHYYKIPDDSVGHKPYDCFVLQQSLAYIVVGFGPRLTDFVFIPVHIWQEKTKKQKSVTKEQVLKWEDVEVVKIPSKNPH